MPVFEGGGIFTDMRIIAVGFMGAALFWMWARQRYRRWLIKRAGSHGRKMEQAAPQLLRDLGFVVVAHHPTVEYTWWIDDQPRTTQLRVDYLVRRGRKTYVVEVKTGNAARIESGATRRQLLEYGLHYPVDGVLVLDADEMALHEIEFPHPVIPRRGAGSVVWLLFVVAVASGVAWWLDWPK